MPFTPTEIETIYRQVLDGDPDISQFSMKDIKASKDNLDAVMQSQPDLVKAMMRTGIMKATDIVLKALTAEAHECLPIMLAISNIISKTLEHKTEHEGEIESEFFVNLIRNEVNRAWIAIQEAFVDHLKEQKKEN
jgi:trans-2-enoyl-CoA reductase